MFGDLVRRYRRRAGLTQEHLAAKSGLAVRGIRQIERGGTQRPRPHTVHVLADALGVVGPEREQFLVAAAGVEEPRATTGPPVPGQLPPVVAGFTGRRDYLDEMTALLREGDRPPAAVVVSALAGMAGIGKTALAVRWAHLARDGFPDGQLYINLRGFDPSGTAMSPAEAVRILLDGLGVPSDRIPAGFDAQVGLYRSVLTGRRMLVVLDNARDALQVRPLLPGARGCCALVTSRDSLSGLAAAEGARLVTLDLLSNEEARELLQRRLGRRRTAAEPEAVDEIIGLCGRLPLALAVVAAKAAARPAFPLASLVAELRRAGLEALAVGDEAADVRAVFGWSIQTLSPGAARLFRLLGLHPGPDISVPAAASLVGKPVRDVSGWLGELTQAHLLTENAPGRYIFHDLLRAYAAELVEAGDSAHDRAAAMARVLDHYVHTGHTAALLLMPKREPLDLPGPRDGVVVSPLTDEEEASAWFGVERPVLLAAIGAGAAAGLDRETWRLAWTLVDHLHMRGYWEECRQSHTTALAAARRAGDPRLEAFSHWYLGGAWKRLGGYDQAEHHLTISLRAFQDFGDSVQVARTRQVLALVAGDRKQAGEAVRQARQALLELRRAGHLQGQALAHNTLGYYLCELGRYPQARAHCERAIAILRRTGERQTEACVWDTLGTVHMRAGETTQAVSCYERAVNLFGPSVDQFEAGCSLERLGDAYRVLGDLGAARSAWEGAITMLRDLTTADVDRVRAKLDELAQART